MNRLEVIIDGKRVAIASITEARNAWYVYRMENGIGSRDMKRHDGKIFQGKRLIARVSPNGRIWNPDGTEYDPSTALLFPE